jgi:L-alanine-DL-glutamate epimerase-like enolase superfamily enzyme
MIASGGVTFPEADVTNCSGVTAFIKIAHMAEAFNLPITSHGAHDVTIQLLAALPNRSYLVPFTRARNLTSPQRPTVG